MTEEQRAYLFHSIRSRHNLWIEQLNRAYLHKKVRLITAWPRQAHSRIARINGIIIQDGAPLFLCMVLRHNSDDVLNSESWTRQYRPWGEFVLNEPE
jgi:hypothetical protein